MGGGPRTGAGGLACEACGQLPEPQRLRLTLAKLGAALPLELALHAAVLAVHPPYIVAALSLAVMTTVLVIWVVEPSAMRLLGRWLHAPALREREQLHASEFLWRVRVVINDQPGALEHITRELAAISVSILTLHVHPLEKGVMDEIIVGADASMDQADLAEAVRRAGGREIRIWPTTASALVDGQTHALTLAARVSHQPEALPGAVAELLGARLITGSVRTPGPETNTHDQLAGTVLRIPSPWSGLFAFTRPGSPFTPAERARAYRLAQIAEAAALVQNKKR